MAYTRMGAGEIAVKTVITHTVTYFVVGLLALLLLDYRALFSHTSVGILMRPLNDPMVMAGPLLQPVRGLLFGFVFYVLQEPFFGRKNGWLVIWLALVSFGILGTFGPPPGSLEGFIYTTVPVSIQLTFLPEVLLQSFLLSWIVFQWVNHREKKWVAWAMGAAFVVVLLLPAMGLASIARR